MPKKFNRFCDLTNGTTIVELSQGQWTILDTEDWQRVKSHSWSASWRPNTRTFYALTGFKRNGKPTTTTMNQMVLNPDRIPGILSDHINHDTLDNRRSNLRRATMTENTRNKPRQRNNTSGYIGVTHHRKTRNGKTLHYWFANVGVFPKRVHKLFPFTDEGKNQAGRWVNEMKLLHHGEFAYLNDVPPSS